MVVKNNNIHILPTVFNIIYYNLVCVFRMTVWICFMILVAMVTIVARRYRLPSYQHTYSYNMEKCHLLAVCTVINYMSTKPPGNQHSEIAVAFFKLGLWTELSSKMRKSYCNYGNQN